MTQKRDRSVKEGHIGMIFDAIKKWPGVRASALLSSGGSATSGLLFMQASWNLREYSRKFFKVQFHWWKYAA